MKGISSSELVIAASIYIIVIIFFVQMISQNLVSFSKDVEKTTKKNIAESIAKVLFESKGLPGDWNESNVKQLGLCKSVLGICIISNEKINSFTSLSPEEVKNLLNLKDYNFRVMIKDSNDNIIFDYNSSSTFGLAEKIQKDVLNESLAQLKAFVEVW